MITYDQMIEEVQNIITEGVFASRWTLIEAYHCVGAHIVTYATTNKEKEVDVVQQVAKDIKKSNRTIYNAVKFFKTYPQLDKLPGGKNITWRKIVYELLPEPQEPKEIEAKKDEFNLNIIKQFLYTYCPENNIEPAKLELEELLLTFMNWRK